MPIPHDATLYRQRHKIDRLKDWRRIHTRYDRCAHTFMSAICIAATVAQSMSPNPSMSRPDLVNIKDYPSREQTA